MRSSVSFVMNLCFCVCYVVTSLISWRLFLVIIFLGFVLGKLFRLCFVFIFVYIFCLPWHVVHLLVLLYIVRFIYASMSPSV